MAEKYKETAVVVSQEQIADGIYGMWLQTEQIARAAKPGQFISVYCHSAEKLLPRPISLCEIDREQGRVRIVYRVTGKNTGTEEFSTYKPGDQAEILGPLGNGFPLESGEGKTSFLIGGGIGIPPMLELAKNLDCEKTAVIGYRDQETFLADELRKYADVVIATEDGSVGTKGNVIDAIRAEKLTADIIYACGPTPMLKALKAYAMENGIECYISLEEKMACGIGACLGCVCHSKDIDEHSNVRNKRICKDGPVFRAEEVELLTPDEQRERIVSGIMIKKEEQA